MKKGGGVHGLFHKIYVMSPAEYTALERLRGKTDKILN
jgi:hypothetical protein